jgi:alkaline phosphatase
MAVSGLICAFLASTAGAAPVKNIILMISDGQGFNTVRATELYAGEPACYEAFPVKIAASTYSASNDFKTNPLGYDPAKAWADFNYVRTNATDSAAAASALNTGVKVYDGKLNWTAEDKPLKTLAEFATEKGKSTGAISTVMFSHATPAGVAAHNTSRGNYPDIAKEMIYSSDLDVIMGCGHPLFLDTGCANPNPVYTFVGGEETWKDITDADGANGFKFIDQKDDFVKLADGTLPLPKKLLGIARSGSTLQAGRSAQNVREVHPETFKQNVPDLAMISRGALRVLQQNPNGFYLMIEGGAIDWANHNNAGGRMIEEQMDFNNAVQAVVEWVEQNSSWEETLLIVTADHETGFLWNANDHFAPIAFNGPKQLPGMVYNSKGHTNSLVPLYAKGAGSELFRNYATDFDLMRGKYVDNTDVFNVMHAALGCEPRTKTYPRRVQCTTKPAATTKPALVPAH